MHGRKREKKNKGPCEKSRSAHAADRIFTFAAGSTGEPTVFGVVILSNDKRGGTTEKWITHNGIEKQRKRLTAIAERKARCAIVSVRASRRSPHGPPTLPPLSFPVSSTKTAGGGGIGVVVDDDDGTALRPAPPAPASGVSIGVVVPSSAAPQASYSTELILA